MIEVYTRKDLERAVEHYINYREYTGLSRDTSKQAAVNEVVDSVKLRTALVEDGIMPHDEQTRAIIAAKKQTDKLSPAQ